MEPGDYLVHSQNDAVEYHYLRDHTLHDAGLTTAADSGAKMHTGII